MRMMRVVFSPLFATKRCVDVCGGGPNETNFISNIYQILVTSIFYLLSSAEKNTDRRPTPMRREKGVEWSEAVKRVED